jgi:hypothetical protein
MAVPGVVVQREARIARDRQVQPPIVIVIPPAHTGVEGRSSRELEELAVDWRDELPGPLGEARPGIRTAAAERVYRAVVDFQADGRSYEVVANARAAVHLYPLGSKVDVVFPPGKPERARLAPELPDFWVQAGLLFIATVVGAGSGYTWWKLVRLRAARRRVVKPDR